MESPLTCLFVGGIVSPFERWQPLAIFLSATMGLVLSRAGFATQLAEIAIEPLLVAVLYATFLPIPLQQFGRAFRNRSVTLASLAINFVWTPLLAWGLGALFLAHAPDLRLGLLMLLVTPCTDWYLVFTGLAKGDVALGSALLPLNAILQLVLLPVYLWGLGGSFANIAPQTLLASIAIVFLLPFGLAALTRNVTQKRFGKLFWQNFLIRAETGQLLALNMAIAAIFAARGEIVLQQPAILFQLLPPLVLFFILNWYVSQGVGRYFNFPYPQRACLSCTTLARNSPVALAIAVSAFPNRPFISLALVVGPLVELPILALVSQALLRLQRRISRDN